MAETIKGINVVIGAETTGLSKALADVNKKSRDIQSELKQVDKLLKLDPKNTELLAQKQKLLADAIANTSDKLNRLKSAQEQVNQQFARGEINEEQYRAFQREIAKTEQELKNLEQQAQSMKKTFADLGDSLQKTGQKIGSIGQTMTKSVTAPIVAVGTAAFAAGDAVDDAMDTIRKGTGATGPALEALGEDFKAVFADVPDDAGTVSAAIADLNTRLGLTGKPLQDLTRQMLDLARVAGTDVATTIEATTRLFGDWSIATEDQSESLDYLWKVSQSTGIGVDTLAEKLVQFGAPLRQMGFSFEESAALMGKWEKEGVNSELVLGSLRIAMGNFARDNIPMREGLDQTIQKIQELGPGAEATALAMEVFGARAGPDMAAAILEGRFAVDDLMNSIAASPETISGASDDIAGFGEAMAEMKNEIMLALEPLGTILLDLFEQLKPHLQTAIDFIAQLIQKFSELNPQTQGVILAITGLVAAIGPIMMVLGPVISGFGSLLKIAPELSKTFGLISGAGKGLSAVFGFLTSPIGLVVAAIAAVIAIGVVLYKNWDEISKWLSDTWNSIKETATNIWNGIKDFFVNLWNGIKETATNIWNGIKDEVMTPINAAKDSLSNAWNTIKTTLTNVWDGIKTTAANIWNGIKTAITTPIDSLKGLLSGIWSGITTTASDAWNGLKRTASDIFGKIKDAILAPFKNIHIPMPHFSFSTKPVNVAGIKFSIPDVDVDWYAKGAIFTSPQIIGVGEAGPEAVVPLDKLNAIITDAVNRVVGEQSRSKIYLLPP